MRLLHTSDWHLGHALRDFAREEEHAAFLAWLLDLLEGEEIDAMLVAGDVFDTSNPSAAAEQAWYRFLAEACRRMPRLQIVAVAGNHDSAARLEAPESLLSPMGVRVVGAMPRGDERALERACVPLRGPSGQVEAWAAAVPFLRPADLPVKGAQGDDADPLVEGVRGVYGRVVGALRERRSRGQAIVALGHLYMVGGRVSELSERKILGGNQHALPDDIFPEEVAYAALGHLHLAQRVGRRETVRYAGSPLPLSMSEASYPHQVVLVDLDGEGVSDVRPVKVPRSVAIERVPEEGSLPLPELLERLAALDAPSSLPHWRWPYVEACVELSRPLPGLVRQIEEAIAGKGLRLVRVSKTTQGTGLALPESMRRASLDDLTPDEVFRERYRRDHDGEVPPELEGAFHELLDGLHQERGG